MFIISLFINIEIILSIITYSNLYIIIGTFIIFTFIWCTVRKTVLKFVN